MARSEISISQRGYGPRHGFDPVLYAAAAKPDLLGLPGNEDRADVSDPERSLSCTAHIADHRPVGGMPDFKASIEPAVGDAAVVDKVSTARRIAIHSHLRNRNTRGAICRGFGCATACAPMCKPGSRQRIRLNLSHLVIVKPVGSVFFDGDSHQLAAGSHSRLVEQLLNDSLDRTFRDLQIPCDFFVSEAIEDS